MSLFKFKSLSFLLVVLLLLTAVQSIDWQGYGNMSASNLTTIWDYINPRIGKVGQDVKTAIDNYQTALKKSILAEFSTNFSDYLNEQYHPAWNVFVFQTAVQKDAILYGYAFRDHWMWYNGYISSGISITFIIWKDYNCQVWTTIGPSNTGTLDSTTIISALVGVNDVNPNTDIWGKTKKFMDQLVTKTGFSGDDKAFTIIASEDLWSTNFIGRACLAGANTYYVPTTSNTYSPSSWGNYVILQMR